MCVWDCNRFTDTDLMEVSSEVELREEYKMFERENIATVE